MSTNAGMVEEGVFGKIEKGSVKRYFAWAVAIGVALPALDLTACYKLSRASADQIGSGLIAVALLAFFCTLVTLRHAPAHALFCVFVTVACAATAFDILLFGGVVVYMFSACFRVLFN